MASMWAALTPRDVILLYNKFYDSLDIFFGDSDASMSSFGVAAPQAGQA
jgi:hypothetical protein